MCECTFDNSEDPTGCLLHAGTETIHLLSVELSIKFTCLSRRKWMLMDMFGHVTVHVLCILYFVFALNLVDFWVEEHLCSSNTEEIFSPQHCTFVLMNLHPEPPILPVHCFSFISSLHIVLYYSEMIGQGSVGKVSSVTLFKDCENLPLMLFNVSLPMKTTATGKQGPFSIHIISNCENVYLRREVGLLCLCANLQLNFSFLSTTPISVVCHSIFYLFVRSLF